jgi:hypothetical protein
MTLNLKLAKEFKKIKLKNINNNILPKSFGKFRFIWLINFNDKEYLRNRNQKYISKKFFNKNISRKEHYNFLKSYKQKLRIDFVIIKNSSKKMIGAINLKKTSSYFEIGKFISNKNMKVKE